MKPNNRHQDEIFELNVLHCCNILKLKETIPFAMYYYKLYKGTQILEGTSPKTKAAALIYISSMINGKHTSRVNIADVLNITCQSISNVHKKYLILMGKENEEG